MFKHILIPTDGSALALKAAKAGIRLAAQHGARVTVFHAVDAWQPVYTSAYAADARTFVDFEKHATDFKYTIRAGQKPGDYKLTLKPETGPAVVVEVCVN
jgi:nucleotide-binding universal stress UspA family protein